MPFAINGVLTIENLRNNIYSEKKDSLTREVDMVFSIVKSYYTRANLGKITHEEAQVECLSEIRNIRFGPNQQDYFWIHTLNNVNNQSQIFMLMDPSSPELEGKDISHYADQNGKMIFVDMNNLIRNSTSGSAF
ncbi:MAG: cache domain-containing protein, partial [Candidatus Thorarchaeota archaeon]